VDDEELEVHLADLKYQVENLKMLIASVEADLARKDEDDMMVRSTEAWLLALSENLVGVERDTEEAFDARRELTSLLVERIAISRNAEDRPRVDVTYRFGPPEGADGVQNSEQFAKTHGRLGGPTARTSQDELLRGRRRGRARSVRIGLRP